MHPGILNEPHSALSDPKAVELLRVWVANGGQHVSLAPLVWDDPAMWGMMLVDLAKHLSNAYEEKTGQPKVEILERIRLGFDVEWETATAAPTGTFDTE